MLHLFYRILFCAFLNGIGFKIVLNNTLINIQFVKSAYVTGGDVRSHKKLDTQEYQRP